MYHLLTSDIFIFVIEADVRLLVQSSESYQQMFALHVLMRGKLLTVIYYLIVRKDLLTGFQLDSTTFLCDFETALIPAIQGNFPNTQVQGCFFHFYQAVLRKEAESENADGISIFSGEPCTPGFEILDVGISGQVEAFFQYFQQEWLLDAKVLLCNVYSVAVPTTNHLEGWHSRMNKRARENHLGFCQFLQLIIDEQGKTETVVRRMDDGYTWGRGSVRRSAAYGIRQRLVAAPMRRFTSACSEKQKYFYAQQSAD
ncbi:hypothetical protein T06_133 [Trichinella sp. T6]|nr:hypothetical protein T06_133 [Trichinella sp. T6]